MYRAHSRIYTFGAVIVILVIAIAISSLVIVHKYFCTAVIIVSINNEEK